ncbi:hypothetical protein BB561_006092, partial [Smittium simulii]
MIFNKSLLSVWFLAQALLQTSVSADETKTKVQSYNVPAATNAVNGAIHNNNRYNNYYRTCAEGTTRCAVGNLDSETCSNGKWVTRKCSGNELCKIGKDNVAGCAKIDEPKCTEGATRCAVETSGSETCIGGEWVLRKCSGNEFCMIIPENIAKCVDYNNIPICVDGTNRCAFDINGTETCVGGKFVLKNCGDNEKCEIINGNFAKCINHYPTCTEGTTRCAVGNLDSETCSNGKWVTRKCSGNELCKVGKDNVAGCAKIDPPCNKGYQKCNSEQTGYDECVNGKLEFKSCGPNNKCYALNGFRILCGSSNDVAECKEGTTRCASEGIDSETCSNGKWVTRKCSGNELCKVGKDNVAKCTKIDESVCREDSTRCAVGNLDSETCSNGKWVTRKCSGNELCKVGKDNVAKCTKIDES